MTELTHVVDAPWQTALLKIDCCGRISKVARISSLEPQSQQGSHSHFSTTLHHPFHLLQHANMASNHHQPTFSPNRSMKASAFQRTQLENSNSPASPKRLVLTQSTTISPVSSPRRTGFNESETNSPRSSRTPAQVREEDKLGNGWKGNIVTEWRENGTKRAESADSNDEFVMIEKIDCRGETSREKEQRIELEFSKLLVSHLVRV